MSASPAFDEASGAVARLALASARRASFSCCLIRFAFSRSRLTILGFGFMVGVVLVYSYCTQLLPEAGGDLSLVQKAFTLKPRRR